MPPLSRWVLALSLACLASGCTLLTSDEPIPLVADIPNPAPVRGYKVLCRSVPDPTFAITGVFHTGCTQVIPETNRAVRAKG